MRRINRPGPLSLCLFFLCGSRSPPHHAPIGVDDPYRLPEKPYVPYQSKWCHRTRGYWPTLS